MDESSSPAARAPAGPLWAARILALAGFVDAAYLTSHHYAGTSVACGPGGGCEFVLTSRYAMVGPVPVAAIGLAYYAVASLLAWTPAGAWTRRAATAFLALVTAALGVSTVLFWIQAALVDAWCRYCLVSAAVTTLLFVAALLLRRGVAAAEDRAPSTLEPAR